MNTVLFLLFALAGLILLIVHSFIFRGARTTVIFFIGGFLYGIFKGNAPTFWKFLKYIFYGTTNVQPHPYFFTNPIIKIGEAPLIECLGWTFTFYLSWTLSEKILSKTNSYNNKIFPTLLLSCMISSTICYSIETACIVGGLWQWLAPLWQHQSNCFIGIPPHAIMAWFYAASDMLLVFFLIECSKYRIAPWKLVFLPLFAVHQGFVGLFFTKSARHTEEYFLIIILIALAFLNKMDFISGNIKITKRMEDLKFHTLLNYLPETALFLMLIVVFIIEIILKCKPEFIVTSLPLFFVFLLSVPKASIPIIFLSSIIIATIGGKSFYALAVFPFVVFLLWISNKVAK